MDYEKFCQLMKAELPLNRKERFYTGTIFPALIFNDELRNFQSFLRKIEGFPAEAHESLTEDDFLFYTEYNLRESAGHRSVGTTIHTDSNDTPDVIIEIVQPRLFIIVEAKMFDKVSQEDLANQIRRQKTVVGNALKRKYSLNTGDFFYIALVPEKLPIRRTDEFQVFNWEFFLDESNGKFHNNRFHPYLRFALENYDRLLSRPWEATTVAFHKTGQEIYELEKDNSLWVGRDKGEQEIVKDIQTGKWKTREYDMNTVKPPKGRPGNWITAVRFQELVKLPDQRSGLLKNSIT